MTMTAGGQIMHQAVKHAEDDEEGNDTKSFLMDKLILYEAAIKF
jgi:hypothetical protein